MSTINISLPQEQISFIDKLILSYGFANRSEFIRSLLRSVSYSPALITKAATFPFVVPQEKSAKKIVSDFKKTKKYSPDFLKDFEEGLKSSSYFVK